MHADVSECVVVNEDLRVLGRGRRGGLLRRDGGGEVEKRVHDSLVCVNVTIKPSRESGDAQQLVANGGEVTPLPDCWMRVRRPRSWPL